MKVIRFLIDDNTIDVVAPNVQAALKHLCEYGYLDGVSDDGTLDWSEPRLDEVLSIRCDDDLPDADDLAMPGVKWDPATRVLSAPVSSWPSSVKQTSVIGQTEW